MSFIVGSLVYAPSTCTNLLYDIPKEIADSTGNGLVKLAYIPGVIEDITDGIASCRLHWDANVVVKANVDTLKQCSLNDDLDIEDFNLSYLTYGNDATVLYAIQHRFNSLSCLHMYVGSTIICINPIGKYLPSSVKKSESNIEAFAASLLALKDQGKSVTAVMRGCSGSGKTEGSKVLLQHLLLKASTYDAVRGIPTNATVPLGTSRNPFVFPPDLETVGKSLSASVLLLEHMGNAKMERHPNSSRHIKEVTIKYDTSGKLSSVAIAMSLLDLSRYSAKDNNCKPFHLYALLIGGLMESRNSEFKFTNNQRDAVFSNYNKSVSAMSQEYEYFREVLLNAGIGEEAFETIIRLLAACIHFQSLTIVGSDSAILASQTKSHVSSAESLLGAETFSTNNLIIKKKEEKMGRVVSIDQRPAEAKGCIDAVCNEIYMSILLYLLDKLNRNMSNLSAGAADAAIIRIIDTPGWEVIEVGMNGIAQFCYNYVEEKMTCNFMEHRFKNEIQKYAEENVILNGIQYDDKQCYIELFETPPTSLIYLLEEACCFSRGDDKSFLEKSITINIKTKLFRNGGHKNKMSAFYVKHTFGDVLYDSDGFVAFSKNKLTIQATEYLNSLNIPLLKEAIAVSKNKAVIDETSSSSATNGSDAPAAPAPVKSSIRSMTSTQTVSKGSLYMTKAKESVGKLINGFGALVQHVIFIRPNADLEAQLFNPMYVNEQVKQLELGNLTVLAKAAFNVRYDYRAFYDRYRCILSEFHPTLPPVLSDRLANHELISYCKGMIQECIQIACLPNDENTNGAIAYGFHVLLLKDWISAEFTRTRTNVIRKMQLASTLMQAVSRMYIFRKHYCIMKLSSVAIQKTSRKYVTQKLYMRKRKAATLIKAFYRSVKCWKSFNLLKACALLIKSKFLGAMIDRLRYKRLQRTTRGFQGIARGFIIRNRVNRILRYATVMQRAARSFLIRNRRFHRGTRAAKLIQTIYRGWHVREVHAYVVYAIGIRRTQRIGMKAARIIQFAWRALSIVRRKKLLIHSTIALQRWARVRNQYMWFKKVKKLVKWLQVNGRRILATKKVHVVRSEAMMKDVIAQMHQLRVTELNTISSLKPTSLVIGGGLMHGTNSAAPELFSSCVVAYDMNMDVNEAYPEGWLKTIFDFSETLKEKKATISKVAMGSYHTVIVDDKSNVYCFGSGDYGQLGLKNRKSYSKPRFIDTMYHLLDKEERFELKRPNTTSHHIVSISAISCGRDHTLVLSSLGSVYSWGSNKFGQLGLNNFESSAIPHYIGNPLLKKVRSIASGAFHSVCVTGGDKLYIWGLSKCLGNGADAKDSCDVITVDMLANKKVQKIACGDMFTVVLSGRSLYSWGTNSSGQLGYGKQKDSYTPVEVAIPFIDTKDVRLKTKLLCSGNHSMMIVNNTIYMWGSNKYGQIGNGITENAYAPYRIDIPKECGQIVSASLTWKSSNIITNLGNTYMWGSLSLLPFMLELQSPEVSKGNGSGLVLIPTQIIQPDVFGSSCGISTFCTTGLNALSVTAIHTIAKKANSNIRDTETMESTADVLKRENSAKKNSSVLPFVLSTKMSTCLVDTSVPNSGGTITTSKLMQVFNERHGGSLRLDKSHFSSEKSDERNKLTRESMIRKSSATGRRTSPPRGKGGHVSRVSGHNRSAYDRTKEGTVTQEGILQLLSPRTTIIQTKRLISKSPDDFTEMISMDDSAAKATYSEANSGVGIPRFDKNLLRKRVSARPGEAASGKVNRRNTLFESTSMKVVIADAASRAEKAIAARVGVASASYTSSVADSNRDSKDTASVATGNTKSLKKMYKRYSISSTSSISSVSDLATMIAGLKQEKIMQEVESNSYKY